jgi:hypothetical protein
MSTATLCINFMQFVYFYLHPIYDFFKDALCSSECTVSNDSVRVSKGLDRLGKEAAES